MANALKTLFTDIATSIRGGLPDEGTMSPYSFPGKIDEIVASMGSGGTGGNSGVSVTSGTPMILEDFDYEVTNFFSGGGNSLSSDVSITIPEDAILLGFLFRRKLIGFASDTSTVIGYSDFFDIYMNKQLTETSLGNGTKKIVLGSFNETCSNASYVKIDSELGKTIAFVIMPNVDIKDDVLYAGEGCKALCFFGTGSLVRSQFYYLEGVDLRGSQITSLGTNDFYGIDELKIVYLSECLTEIGNYTFADCLGLAEIHFTSKTPPTIKSYSFRNLSTTCKIYVPAGTLDAYTSASKYPDPATYTYIEE